jgi:hypothetical protein
LKLQIGLTDGALDLLIVSPDGAVTYGYSKGASQLYVIKGLK